VLIDVPVVEKSALVPHSAAQMYELVSDVDAYQDFLPWCRSSRLVARSETELIGELEVSRMGIHQKFSTINTLEPYRRMRLSSARDLFVPCMAIGCLRIWGAMPVRWS